MKITGYAVPCVVLSQMVKHKWHPVHSPDRDISVSVRSMASVGGQEYQGTCSHLCYPHTTLKFKFWSSRQL